MADSLTTVDGALAAARDAADRIRALAANEAANGVRLSAAELFVTTIEEELRNSRGLTGTSIGTHLLLEITLLARHGGEGRSTSARPRHGAWPTCASTRRSPKARVARDKLEATAPQTRIGPVVMSGEALVQMFSGAVTDTGALLTQASACFAYSKISRLEVGGPIWGDREPVGDRITVRITRSCPTAVASYRFDPDGVAAEDLLVIEDGVLRQRPPPSAMPNTWACWPTAGQGHKVRRSTTGMADLLDGDGPAYHVLSLLRPDVDELTGDFGMEIRIGYERGPDGVQPRPVGR